MAIVLVRHGETEGNAARILQKPDIPLNAQGIRQAQRLAERIPDWPIAHILCSDLKRALMTAAPLAERLGLAIETTPLLAERNFGDVRGTPYAELPGDPFALDYAPPNGETWAMFHERVTDAFQLMLARASELESGDLLVVTHGLVCRSIFERFVTVDERPASFSNCSVSLLDPRPPHRAELVNCCRHLDEAGIEARALGPA